MKWLVHEMSFSLRSHSKFSWQILFTFLNEFIKLLNIAGQSSTNSYIMKGEVAAPGVLELFPGFWNCSQCFGVAPRILELLPGFWNCSQDFGVAPRILEFLPGFWSCSQDFGIAPRVLQCSQDFRVAPRVLEQNVKIYQTLYETSFKYGTLKPKI